MPPYLANLFNPATYLNPWSVAAGVLLIAAPIIIHLIHRMRFKRVKWAAMEFLLKAQKRMKRKMIIEQLLLLVLRCLLMLLLGLLVAKYFGFDATGTETVRTYHYVILDDSPSMGDPITDDGAEQITALEKGKRTICDRIGTALAAAPTEQLLDVARASEPDPILTAGKVSTDSMATLKASMGGWGLSSVRSDLATLIRKGGESLNINGAETGKVIHVVSDFRTADWQEQSESVKKVVKELSDGGVKVHFIDVAHPYRSKDRKQPTAHDNIGITELKPAKAVVGKYEAVEFTLKIKNFGAAEVKDIRVSIRVNGDEGKGGRSVGFQSIPPGQEAVEKFELNFDRAGSTDNPFANKTAGNTLSEDEANAMKKAFERFNLVSAVVMTKEAGGIDADNVRHTAVEVRDALPILVVDGEPDRQQRKETSNTLYLKKFLASSGTAYQWNDGKVSDLATLDLTKYSFVLLLNVPALNTDARKNVESYATNGGGVGFWLGGAVKPAEYNKELYRDGEGLFPAPLPPDPFPAKNKEQMSPEEVEADEKRVEKLKYNIFQKKLLVRDAQMRMHPAMVGLYTDARGAVRDPDELEKFYRFVTVERYWAIERVGKWADDKSVNELMCLANEKEPGFYDKDADALMRSLPVAEVDAEADAADAEAAAADRDNDKPKATAARSNAETARAKAAALRKVQADFRKTLGGAVITTSMLAEQFDRLLSDQRNEGDKDEALLREFWTKADTDLKNNITRLRDRMKYGYPFYLAKTFGRGRVTVITTTSGEAWSKWPAEVPGSVSFIPVMKELVNYLAGGGVDDTRACGRPIEFLLDADGYDAKVLTARVTHAGKPGEAVPLGADKNAAPITLGGQFDPLPADTKKEKLVIVGPDGKPTETEVDRKTLLVRRTDTATPGVYLFGLEQRRPKAGGGGDFVTAAEYRFAPVNLDVNVEGDLKRASTDDLIFPNSNGRPAVGVHGPDDRDWLDDLKNKKTDLSEMGWLFLFLFLVLVAEQALAVKLSYHAANDTMSEHAPSAAAAMRRSNPTEAPPPAA